jgi:hypothetical protein
MEDQYAEVDLQLHPSPVPPLQGKRTLDNEPYLPTSGAQREANGKMHKKRKRESSLPPHVKRNVIQEVATVRMVSAEDSAQCVVSGASETRTVIEFCRLVSDLTPSSEVSDIFFWGRSNADCLQMDRLEWSWGRKYLSLNVDTRKNIQTREWPSDRCSKIHIRSSFHQSVPTSTRCSTR